MAQSTVQDTLADSVARRMKLDEAAVEGRLTANAIRQQAYSVEVLDLDGLRGQNVDLNRLMDRLTGIRVREAGGLGSDASYTIHGLSGKSVRFFVDGIPAEQFGNAFRLSNFPANTVERVEVYKGVVPVHLASDALGGAINIVTRRDIRPYLDLSYAVGSFNTHRAAVSGRWRHARTGFTVQGNAFFNSSENDYRVWGTGVEVADATGRPIPGFSARRFNDDYGSYWGRAEIGVTQRPWADRLLLGANLSRIDRGVQTGRTMAFVFGQVRYGERAIIPSLNYAKSGWLGGRLDVEAYAAYSGVDSRTLDTGTVRFNWAGRPIAEGVQGELGGIYAQRSIYRTADATGVWRAALTFRLTESQRFQLAYNGQALRRQGSDDLSLAEWTIPLRYPQRLDKQVAGLAYELTHGALTHILSAKHFRYRGSSHAYDYRGSDRRELIPIGRNAADWGIGYAGKAVLHGGTIVKLSAERALRMPDPVELFGDGTTILNAPGLRPERSMNANAAVQRIFEMGSNRLDASMGVFFRATRDLIWLGEGNHLGTTRYENLNRIRTMGAEAAATFHYGQSVQLSANVTYQDIRNRERLSANGTPTLIYNDRLRNVPDLLANAEVRLKSTGGWFAPGRAWLYASAHYVPAYFLWWPSLGTRSLKATIPEQFVQDLGASYRFGGIPCQLSVDCHNLFDRQVYDNYLLQRPGRFMSLKINYLITNSK